jgi:alkyl sulfatase BDS1-like metallo-beta-lactamase superfamily hydrolase
MSTDQLFDTVAIRIDGPRCWDEAFAIDWVFTDVGHTYRTEPSNGVVVQHLDPSSGSADFAVVTP